MENKFSPVGFTHATLNTQIWLSRELVFAVWKSESAGYTLILAAGGAMVPVKEDFDYVRQLLYKYDTGNKVVVQKE